MIPLRASNVKVANKWPPKIIIHHTACKMGKFGEFKFDRPKFQTDKFQDLNYAVTKDKETGFNFILDKVNNDYQVIVSQPLLTLCEYSDLEPYYHRAIHIALMGDYNENIPQTRLYRVLGYRLLGPLMRLFYLKENDILFHNEISTDETVTCPGKLVEWDRLIMGLRSTFRRKNLSRTKG
jgi:hypothetical protein